MSTTKENELQEFARKVERLCDFLLEKIKDEDDRAVVFDLREEATHIQFDYSEAFNGLHEYMSGLSPPSEESKET